ncbi:MAG: ABC transporter permease [Spirochaetales bacterium]|nr:ABC transporter permease [Spirochaetales bacterium]
MLNSILIEGLIYGIMVLGVFSTFRVLNFCDMTVDGSFPMGACVLAACLTLGLPPAVAILIAFLSGLLAGLVTSAIYTKLKIPDLLAGILTMTMLYSVNLRIMSNKANISFLKIETLFSKIQDKAYDLFDSMGVGLDVEWGLVIFLVIFVGILKVLMDLFYHTDLGLTMGALGSNPQLIVSQGVNPNIVRTIGICFGNGLAALAGSFAAMYNGFADVGMGTGIVVSGLASLMLGEFIIKSNRIGLQTLRVFIGSIVYRALMILARSYGYKVHITPNDLKLVTGILIIACLIVSRTNLLDRFKKEKGAAK